MTNVNIIILAGGKGTRMNKGRPSPIPKVLIPLGGKPMLSYIIKTLEYLSKITIKQYNNLTLEHLNTRTIKQYNNITIKQFNNSTIDIGKPILVVGYKGEMIKKEFGGSCEYVWQRQRLGTGHAARLAMEFISHSNNVSFSATRSHPTRSQQATSTGTSFDTIFRSIDKENQNFVLILQGDDSAFYRAETLKKFIENHVKEKAVLSFLTTKIPNVKDLGRVIRDKKGDVLGVVEKENLTPDMEKIDEINCGGYLANYDWLKVNIKKIKKHLKKGREYPLPDIIKLAINEKKKVIAFTIPSSQWVGINSPDQLKYAERFLK